MLKDLDRDALVKKHNVAGAIDEINAPLRSQTGQSAQTGSIIQKIPPEGITISNPGTYTFSNDISWSPDPAKGAGAAITVAANDVVLDMGGHKLTAVVQDSSQNLAGIYVHGATNITIKNGTLVDMCYYGVSAEFRSLV